MLAAIVLLFALALVVGWEVFCLADLARADKVRFLPKWGWAVACLIQIPLGGVLYLLLGRVWKPKAARLQRTDEGDPVERRAVVVLDRV